MGESSHTLWKMLAKRFRDDAREWGGARVLLRCVPRTLALRSGGLPFDIERRVFPPPIGISVVEVLNVEGRTYSLGPGQTEASVAFEGMSDSAKVRWGIAWFGQESGWNRFLTHASEAGRMLTSLPDDQKSRVLIRNLNPLDFEDDAARWIGGLIGLAQATDRHDGPSAPIRIWSRDTGWLDLPFNKGALERLVSVYPGDFARKLRRDPLDDYMAVLQSEIYSASAAACHAFAAMTPPEYDWTPPPGGDAAESPEERRLRILQVLAAAQETRGGIAPVAWQSLPGATQSDYAYFIGKGLVDAGFRDSDVHFNDPHYMDVWLKPGVDVSQARSHGAESGAATPPAGIDSDLNNALPNPISNAALASRAKYNDANYMSQAIRAALGKAKKAIPKSAPGKPQVWSHAQLSAAAPHLRASKLKKVLELAGLGKPEKTRKNPRV